jgi:hypothetical protein
MSVFDRVLATLSFLGAVLLTGCGGGGDLQTSAQMNQQHGQGVAVGEPSPNRLDTTAFVAVARTENCANTRNRLFVIDHQYVFWDRAGSCADSAYARTLYGATLDKMLCSQADSIAGPRTSCSDESARPLFDTLVQNHDKADLGLGPVHVIEEVTIPK